MLLPVFKPGGHKRWQAPQTPPPPHLLWGEEKGTVLPYPETRRNQELSPCTMTCQGVGSMTAPHLDHGAKPPGSFLSTPCFLPIKRPRLWPLEWEQEEPLCLTLTESRKTPCNLPWVRVGRVLVSHLEWDVKHNPMSHVEQKWKLPCVLPWERVGRAPVWAAPWVSCRPTWATPCSPGPGRPPAYMQGVQLIDWKASPSWYMRSSRKIYYIDVGKGRLLKRNSLSAKCRNRALSVKAIWLIIKNKNIKNNIYQLFLQDLTRGCSRLQSCIFYSIIQQQKTQYKGILLFLVRIKATYMTVCMWQWEISGRVANVQNVGPGNVSMDQWNKFVIISNNAKLYIIVTLCRRQGKYNVSYCTSTF